ncbi:MAG: 6-carboxytetrahydropterin synthase [Prevotellaceae bacterium]|jgi:6-pyruvoyltetrahydropterin/6-carboxytetrahydropterin synthase|nr:6-carboxytetrahydropterin synthase [Prevotellaceae bacterium]
MKIRLTKCFEFEAAHSLHGYDGACRYIHGHSYRLHVTVLGTPSNSETDPKLGMVMDFGILKQIVKEQIIDRFDHCLMLRKNSPISTEIKAQYQKVELFDFQPTCENILSFFVALLINSLPPTVSLHSIKLSETRSSFAEWFAEDNIVISD